jgi:hypothetical protein
MPPAARSAKTVFDPSELPLSGYTSQLEVLERQVHKEEHKES